MKEIVIAHKTLVDKADPFPRFQVTSQKTVLCNGEEGQTIVTQMLSAHGFGLEMVIRLHHNSPFKS